MSIANYLVIFSLVFLQFNFQAVGQVASLCLRFYGPLSAERETANLKEFLKGPLGTSNQTVAKAIAHEKGKVIFLKDKNDVWVSRHDAIENTLTAEGDVRLPIFLLGPELAAKLGYIIKDLENGSVEIHVPDADSLAEKIGQLNSKLKSKGLEPITYLPIRTGFVTIKETISIILSAKGDYLVHFPYADNDLVIASHEVSFHLGSILLNKKIVSRAREITQETDDFIKIVDKYKTQLGPIYKRLMGQIRIERNFEMDAGLASMVTSPGFTRRDNNMKSYTELMSSFSNRYWNYMLRNVEFLAHPLMQPYEVVIHRMQLITGIDFSQYLKTETQTFNKVVLERARVGENVSLNENEKKVMKQIMDDYVNQSRPSYQTGTAQSWLFEWVQNLDKRIKEISENI